MNEIICHQQSWLENSDYRLISIGLRMMFEELEYQSRPDGTGIPDEAVPELRLGCIKLAKSLELIADVDIQQIANLWVSSASADPLPELRYFARC